ncbi:MAG: hypothetical protein J5698_00820 [Bacteroidaceae bacterium]|nr:hypothetical protein [Bacteroidaceae bacterium]
MEQREQHDACISVAESRQRKGKNHFAQRIPRYEEGKNFFREGKNPYEERKKRDEERITNAVFKIVRKNLVINFLYTIFARILQSFRSN